MPPSRRRTWEPVRSVVLAALLAGCAPDTELRDEGGGGVPGAGAPGGGLADATLLAPMAGAADVPPNLEAVLLRFTEPVTVADGAVTVTSDTGARAPAGLPEPVACAEAGGAGGCVRVPLGVALTPGSTYVVAVANGLVAGAAGPVAGGAVGQFTTAAAPDVAPPLIAGLAVEPSGPCAAIRFETDEPVSATIVLEGGGLRREVAAGAGARDFALAVSLAGFVPGGALELSVAVRDQAGNAAASPAVPLSVPQDLAPLAITEVLANPAGTEPAQEFVEVRNLGTVAIELGGLAIADSKAADILPAATLAPGGYALIVPSGFDRAATEDPRPRAGTPLVVIDARIGADGLSNSGESVKLRAGADGTVISSYGFPVPVSAAAWSGKSVHRLAEDACDQAASWSRIPAEATPGWGVP